MPSLSVAALLASSAATISLPTEARRRVCDALNVFTGDVFCCVQNSTAADARRVKKRSQDFDRNSAFASGCCIVPSVLNPPSRVFKTIISSRTLFCTHAIFIHLTTQFSTYTSSLDFAPQDSGPILLLPHKKCRARDDGNRETQSLRYERQQRGQCSEEPGGSRASTRRIRV